MSKDLRHIGQLFLRKYISHPQSKQHTIWPHGKNTEFLGCSQHTKHKPAALSSTESAFMMLSTLTPLLSFNVILYLWPRVLLRGKFNVNLFDILH